MPPYSSHAYSFTNLEQVNKGETITHDWANNLIDAINVMSRDFQALVQSLDSPRSFFHGELTEDIESLETDKNVDELVYDDSVPEWAKTTLVQDTATDPSKGFWLSGEQHLLFHAPDTDRLAIIPVLNIHLAKLDADLTAGGSVAATIWKVSGGSEVTASITITDKVYDWVGNGGKQDDKVYVAQHRQSKRWYLLGGSGNECKVKVNTDDTCDFLEDQMEEHVTAYDQNEDLVLVTETRDNNGNKTILTFLDANFDYGGNSNLAATYSDTGQYAFIINNGIWEFKPIGPCSP